MHWPLLPRGPQQARHTLGFRLSGTTLRQRTIARLSPRMLPTGGETRRSASSPGFEVEFRSACVVLEAAEDEFCDASDRADAGWRERGTARALLRGLLLAKYGIQDDESAARDDWPVW